MAPSSAAQPMTMSLARGTQAKKSRNSGDRPLSAPSGSGDGGALLCRTPCDLVLDAGHRLEPRHCHPQLQQKPNTSTRDRFGQIEWAKLIESIKNCVHIPAAKSVSWKARWHGPHRTCCRWPVSASVHVHWLLACVVRVRFAQYKRYAILC